MVLPLEALGKESKLERGSQTWLHFGIWGRKCGWEGDSENRDVQILSQMRTVREGSQPVEATEVCLVCCPHTRDREEYEEQP